MKVKALSLLALGLLFMLGAGLPATAEQEPFLGGIAGEALESVPLGGGGDPALSHLLASLDDEQSIVPRAQEAFRVPGAPGVLLVPMSRPARPEVQLFLYHLPERQQSFFLQIETDPVTGPEMRLWGDGPSEILISQSGAVLLPEPGESTFRLAALAQKSVVPEAEAVSVGDALACIARTLGLTLSTTSLQNLLSSAVCSASNTIILGLTAFNCLNPTPMGVLGCTVGIAKLISCNIANCGSLPPSDCQSSMSFPGRVDASWSSSCTAAHRSGRYARYYTFTLSTTTTVQIDLESVLTDPYLILLSGSDSSGSIVTTNDDSGFLWNSRITRRLSPGTYTVEATTYSAQRTGTFTLTLTRR